MRSSGDCRKTSCNPQGILIANPHVFINQGFVGIYGKSDASFTRRVQPLQHLLKTRPEYALFAIS
jgi:hypothetical protein